MADKALRRASQLANQRISTPALNHEDTVQTAIKAGRSKGGLLGSRPILRLTPPIRQETLRGPIGDGRSSWSVLWVKERLSFSYWLFQPPSPRSDLPVVAIRA